MSVQVGGEHQLILCLKLDYNKNDPITLLLTSYSPLLHQILPVSAASNPRFPRPKGTTLESSTPTATNFPSGNEKI